MQSRLEKIFSLVWLAGGGPTYTKEYKFHPVRKWRFDFAWPMSKVAVEIEGGIWTSGRHNRGTGFQADCEKYLEAAMYGWIVIRLPDKMINAVNCGKIKNIISRRLDLLTD